MLAGHASLITEGAGAVVDKIAFDLGGLYPLRIRRNRHPVSLTMRPLRAGTCLYCSNAYEDDSLTLRQTALVHTAVFLNSCHDLQKWWENAF